MRHDLVHGGALDRMKAAFPEAPLPWIDLSTGINPWPYPVGEVAAGAFQHLPTHNAYEACRQAMAANLSAPAGSLTLAPGSELLIRLLPSLISPRRVATLSPSYGDHAATWQAAGAETIPSPHPLQLADEVDAVVVCNPNNPDGQRFEPSALLTAAAKLARRGGWLIVDEAYADLDPALSLAPHGGTAGLILLRSFGKFFGLAGLRLGALLAPQDTSSRLRSLLGVWPVAGPALEIGARAYQDAEWQTETRRKLAEARRRLDAILSGNGLTIAGGTDLFRLVETSDATKLWEALARQGVYVRRFGWSERLIRIGLPPTPTAEDRLAAALSTLEP